MEEISDRFIILKSIDSKENNKKLWLFCEHLGRIMATGRGVRAKNAKLKFLNLPFCVCEGTFFKTGNSFLVKTAKVIFSFSELALNSEKYVAGSVILESLLKFDNFSAKIFDEAIEALSYIAKTQNNEFVYAVKFVGDLIFNIFNLNFDICNVCGNDKPQKVFLNFNSGELTCENCLKQNAKQIKLITVKTVQKFVDCDYNKLNLIECDANLINSLKLFVFELVKGLLDIELMALTNKKM